MVSSNFRACLGTLGLMLALGGCNGGSSAAPVFGGGAAGGGVLPVPADPTTIATDKGVVHGIAASGLVKFLGIPYAAPPAGALRFAAPQPRAAWTTTLQATTFGSPCPQGSQQTTEDCLFLNIWEPAPSGAAMPVYVFIHGGGFSSGSGAGADGSWLAAAGAIVVTINYRLGIFGYLAHPAFDGGTGNVGNYGLEDQQAALRWVHTNIAAFGGDVNNVTLGGESAGGMSTCQNLVSPGAQGLFVRAIVESAPCSFNWQALSVAKQTGAGIASTLGCSGSNSAVAACLRAVPIAQVITAQSGVRRGLLFPSVGGADIPVQPRNAIGKFPILLGGNTLEQGFNNNTAPANEAAYEAALTAVYGSYEPEVLSEYPAANYPSFASAVIHAESDFDPLPGAPEIVFCNDVTTFALTASAGAKPLYAYEFDDPNAPNTTGGAEGPVHTSELAYLYPSTNAVQAAALQANAGSAALSKTMVQYWANFIKTGNPNGNGLAAWPAYTTATTAMQLVPGTVATGTDVAAEHHCSFWNSLDDALSRERRAP